MHLDGALPDSTLQNWFEFYCTPGSSPEHQHHEHQRERAELAARDAARKAAKKPVKRRAYPVTPGVSKGARLRFQPTNLPQPGPLTKKEQRMEQDCRAQEYARVSRRVPHLGPLRTTALRGGRRVYRKLSELS